VRLLLLRDGHGCDRVAQRGDTFREGLRRSCANSVRMSELELDPTLLATLRTLEEHDVELIVVGEVAAAIHANGGFVAAVAIVPGAYGRNVDRLREALLALDARLGIAGRPDERSPDLRQADLRELAPCTFMTSQADIDLSFQPAGTRGYRDLFDDAARTRLAPGVNPLVASPQDLERIARGSAPPLPPAQPPAILPPEPSSDLWAGEQFRAGRA
jgi:hypothetical protein